MKDRGNWIETVSGRQFWPLDPKPEDVFLLDIVIPLRNMCRYGGHVESFYSVAQHSVLVSRVVRPELALRALMHDAAEAYLVDVPRPIKCMLTNYKDMEKAIAGAIAVFMGYEESWLTDFPQEIHDADNGILLAERKSLRINSKLDWGIIAPTFDVEVEPLPPRRAQELFMERFVKLHGFDKVGDLI